MTSSVVDQPTALALKTGGWVKEVERHYLQFPDGEWKIWFAPPHEGRHLKWLPAPNVTEIGEELKWSDYYQYWWRATDAIIPLAEWLYSIMHDADKLAEIWIWSTSNKKGE